MILEIITDVLEYEIEFDLFDIVSFDRKPVDHGFTEDLYLDDNTFIINKKEPIEVIKKISSKIDNVLSTDGAAIVKKSFHVGNVFKYDGCRSSHKNNHDKYDKEKLSFSFYYDLFDDLNFNNLSDSLNSRITNITLKFSTHVNEKQFNDMFVHSNRLFYFVEIPPIVESRIKECLNNIYINYMDAVDIIERSKDRFEVYSDLPDSVRSLFEEYQMQNV